MSKIGPMQDVQFVTMVTNSIGKKGAPRFQDKQGFMAFNNMEAIQLVSFLIPKGRSVVSLKLNGREIIGSDFFCRQPFTGILG